MFRYLPFTEHSKIFLFNTAYKDIYSICIRYYVMRTYAKNVFILTYFSYMEVVHRQFCKIIYTWAFDTFIFFFQFIFWHFRASIIFYIYCLITRLNSLHIRLIFIFKHNSTKIRIPVYRPFYCLDKSIDIELIVYSNTKNNIIYRFIHVIEPDTFLCHCKRYSIVYTTVRYSVSAAFRSDKLW